MLTILSKIYSSDSNPRLSFLFTWFCKMIFKFYCPLTIQGKENLPPPPFIICSNHCSHMDTPVLMLATGLSFHRFGMIAAKDYFFDNTRRKRFLNLFMNLIPINRKCTKTSIINDLTHCKQFVQAKANNLIIYPEGSRSLSGDMRRFKGGIALIACELNLPIVPVHIKGTHQTMPKGQNFPLPGKISAVVGKPIYINPSMGEITQQKPIVFYRQLTENLETQIKELEGKHDNH